MMLITLVVYIYRHEIKVLLYVKFELHPFDRRTPEEHEKIDLTILHTHGSLEFAMNLGERLEEKSFTIKLAVRDFIAGYSILDNIKNFIYQSKHVLLIISEDMLIDSSIVNWTWSECQYKFNVRSNFLIATSTCSNSVYNVLNTEFKKYLKLHQALKVTSVLFFDKIVYTLSSFSNDSAENEYVLYEVNRSLSYEDIEIKTAQRNDIFVIFSDNERGFCRNELIPYLERKKYRVVSMDDINPGSNIMISIQEFVNDSIQTILVASICQSLELDIAFPIVKMETLKRAYNYLIVVFQGASEHTDNSEKTNEYIDFENYMDSHVYIKLQNELQPMKELNAIDNENTENVQSNARYEAFYTV
ncbi:unnamed protein product [Mytilus edulis]|uniref:TIR domain-containing protein n=1 Tax=Mytilus edulis TaxID=6550 RepID=A0A8S3Q201_MYTED|nr:unnamed protein product [Mytilus edulis]